MICIKKSQDINTYHDLFQWLLEGLMSSGGTNSYFILHFLLQQHQLIIVR